MQLEASSRAVCCGWAEACFDRDRTSRYVAGISFIRRFECLDFLPCELRWDLIVSFMIFSFQGRYCLINRQLGGIL